MSVVIVIYALNEFFTPLILGWSISLINVLAGSAIIYKAFQNPGRGFFNIVLLSMVVRMFAITGLVFILIYFFKVEKFSLATIMFFFYFLFLIFEINFLTRNTKNNFRNNNTD